MVTASVEKSLEGRDLTSDTDMAAARAAYEADLLAVFLAAGEEFLSGVIDDATAALGSATITAAGQPRDTTGKFVADPFSFTQVQSRWYAAVRELAADTDLSEEQIRLIMDGSDLPSAVFTEVSEILTVASDEGWTEYRTKRHLSRVLIPKQQEGESRSAYRNSVVRMARLLSTENFNKRIQYSLAAQGYTFKEWVSRHDDRVRSSHVIADGQRVRVQDRFIVGVSRMLYPGDPAGAPEEIWGCRCVLAAAKEPRRVKTVRHKLNKRVKLGAEDTEITVASVDQYSAPTVDAEPVDEAVDDAAEEVIEEEEASPVPDDLVLWNGVIGMEQTMTGDGRMIEDGALRWEDLPIPLRYVTSDVGGHDGAQVVGTIQHIEREDNGRIVGTGTFDMSSEAGREAARQVGENLTNGVSMDLDDVSFEVRVAEDVLAAHEAELDGGVEGEARAVVDGKVVMLQMGSDDEVHVTTSARIRAATIVSIPAFAEAQIHIVEDTDTVGDDDVIGQLGPEDAIDEDDIEEEYNWVDDVGGLPDYIRRIADHLIAQGMTESRAIASAVNTVKRWARGGSVRANGGPNVTAKTVAKAAAALAEWEAKKIRARADAADTVTADGGTIRSALTAGGGPLQPPGAWFQDPRLTEPTPLSITEDGRVSGHLAVWDSCHIAHPDSCVSPPKSGSGYAYFHTGAVLTAEGEELSVGHLTMNTGHADADSKALKAMAHYDNTGAVGADVRVGEDRHGIWVAGAMRPGLADEQVRSLRSAPLSGDWRRVNGSLELVAALAVNVPGFPIPRPAGRRSAGHTQALVASGMVPPRRVKRPGTEGALSAVDIEYLKRLARREKRARADALAAQIKADRVRSFAQSLSK